MSASKENPYWVTYIKEATKLICNKYKLEDDWRNDVYSEASIIVLEMFERKGTDKISKGLIFSEIFEKIPPRITDILKGFSNDAAYDIRHDNRTPPFVYEKPVADEGNFYYGDSGILGSTDGQAILDFDDTMRQVDAELQKLPPELETALRMVWEGEKVEDVSKCLKIPLRTLERRLQQFQEVMNGKRHKGEI